MGKFRSKPVEIEAVQFNKAGDHPAVQYSGKDDSGREYFSVRSKQGRVSVNSGDWIITEPDGSGHYPCAPEVFAAKYEAVEA